MLQLLACQEKGMTLKRMVRYIQIAEGEKVGYTVVRGVRTQPDFEALSG